MHTSVKPTANNPKPIRVLHHLGGLDRGGVETWLLHVRRRSAEHSIHMDFIVRDQHRGDYQKEAESLGSIVQNGVPHRNPFEFAKCASAFIKANGPYDVVHSHIGPYDGIMMWVAAMCRVPVRISHSHNDTRRVGRNETLGWKVYQESSRYLIKRYATYCIGASAEAAESLFGSKWRKDDRTSIIHCGIDLSSFEQSKQNPAGLRRSLGISDDAFVIGHVGRFEAQKNHEFLFAIVKEVLRLDQKAKAVMVGRGPLKDGILSKVAAAGLNSRILVLDPRPDIPQLMLEAMDLFLLPSLHEGLPLVLLEAQAAGLPCIASDTVSRESAVSENAITFLPLSLSAAEWARAILALRDKASQRPSERTSLRGSSFDIDACVDNLFSIYKRAA